MKPGTKHDGEKDRWDLLPLGVLRQVVKVLTFGSKKYADDNWKKVDRAENRYFAAMMRHLYAHRSGEYLDDESGLPHIAHALCCLIFMAWFAIKNHEGDAESCEL
ncbi:MAG: dATP/dGTP diphosphohydrolase domain-containing protein [Bryobacteraceae bacterium]